MHRAQRRHQTRRARARARSARRGCSHPRASAGRARAVGGRLLARDTEQRPHEPTLARGHSQQRAPPRRGGQPVEDRLHLVAGWCGRSRAARRSRQRDALARPVAQRARPRLQVARLARVRRSTHRARPRARRRAARIAQWQWRSSPSACAAQPVVDVQRAHVARAAQRDGDVEQADRVAPARDHRDDRPGPAISPSSRDAREHVLYRRHGYPSRACATNSSVGSEKPFSRTSPMRSKRSRRRRRRGRRPGASRAPRRRRRAPRRAPPG